MVEDIARIEPVYVDLLYSNEIYHGFIYDANDFLNRECKCSIHSLENFQVQM